MLKEKRIRQFEKDIKNSIKGARLKGINDVIKIIENLTDFKIPGMDLIPFPELHIPEETIKCILRIAKKHLMEETIMLLRKVDDEYSDTY